MLKSTSTQLAMIALLAAAPLCAQGAVPAGWMMRFDPPRPGRPAPAPTEASMVTMGSGYHVTSGPMGAAIYYNPKDMGSGIYSVSASLHQAKSMQHESYGIFIGGRNLQDSTENYLYMVIRPLDGGLAIEHRSSNASPTKLVAMTVNDAVNKESATDGSATNSLTIHVAKDTVHFLVNGKLVKALAKSALDGAMTDGQAGIRVNHGSSIHIDGWALKK